MLTRGTASAEGVKLVISAVAGLIPKIEGFAPLPNAAADAFMAMQGGHMALLFGAEYTIGKRLIASMSNEEFNSAKDNPQQFTDKLKPHYEKITQMFESELATNFSRIQELVLDKAFDIEILKVHQNVKLLKELPSAYWEAIFSTVEKIEGTQSSPGTDTRRGTDFTPTSQPDTPPIPTSTGQGSTGSRRTPTSTAHTSAHNDIVQKYRENRILETDAVNVHAELQRILNRNAGNYNNVTRTMAAKLEKQKQKLIQVAHLLAALQKNHQINYGHQVIPFSDKI